MFKIDKAALVKQWYSRTPGKLSWLIPFEWLFLLASGIRKFVFTLFQKKLSVPVVIVGNITVGGTGKTPLVLALAQFFRSQGKLVGILSRGYGATQCPDYPHSVSIHDTAKVIGDEPALLVREVLCPIVVDPNRNRGAQALIAKHNVDLIICDDGLQHYKLARDVEIAVVDSMRRYGNGHCLPVGPLREPIKRLKKVDFIITNGRTRPGECAMKILPNAIFSVGDRRQTHSLEWLNERKIHAIAGIGNPGRYFALLRSLGAEVIEHAFDDHHNFSAEDLDYGDGLPIIMTSKDAVKCETLGMINCWVLNIEAQLDQRFLEKLSTKLHLMQL